MNTDDTPLTKAMLEKPAFSPREWIDFTFRIESIMQAMAAHLNMAPVLRLHEPDHEFIERYKGWYRMRPRLTP